MTATPDISALADRLKRIAGEMERFLGPPEMAPGPDADDLTEAAAALLAIQSENTALRDEAIERGNHWRSDCANWQARAEAAEARIAGLEAALRKAHVVVSDRAAGGRMLTSKQDAEALWHEIAAALQPISPEGR